MKRKTPITLLWCLVITLGAGAAFAQDSPVKKLENTAKKVEKRVIRSTKRTTKAVEHAASGAVSDAKLYTAAALTNMPTPEWNKLRSAYDYPAGDPKVEVFQKEHPTALKVKIKFMGVNNKMVEGLFLRPKAEGVYPCALLLHGLTNTKEIALERYGDLLLSHNLAILALDAPGHGTDRKPNKNMWSQEVLTVAVHEGDRNYRRALDWLGTRGDVDMSRVGLIGYSMGGIMGSILGAVDDRISAFALCTCGDPFRVLARVEPVARREALLDVSPSLYVEHITPRPIAFFNGKEDVVIVQPAAMIVHNAAKDPKEVVWYEGGHDVPAAINKQAVEWLAQKLGADKPPAEKPAPEDQKPPR